MITDMWISLGILTIAIILFITEWIRVDVVAIGVMVALMVSGLLTTQEALAGFSNPAVLTIASLFVIGGAILQTGLAGAIGQRILTIAGSKSGRLTFVIMATVALLSAFMSDTGTVAVLLPAITSLALSAQISPSKLLIPLAYGALLGGASTLIGTPPNIIVSDLLREAGQTPFGFFDYTPIGVGLFGVGVAFMLGMGRRLLPDYQPKQEIQRVETPEELMTLYRLPDNLFRLRVRRGSPLVGKSIKSAQLRKDFSLTVLEILRPLEPRSIARWGDQTLKQHSNEYETITPNAATTILADDILVTQSNSSDVAHAAAYWNLGLQPTQTEYEHSLISNEAGIAEILLPPRSSLVGKTLVETRFGTRYRLTVLGIHRTGREGSLNIKETTLRFGDILLVQGPWKNILELRKMRKDFVVMGQPEAMLAPPARAKAPLAMIIMVGMLSVMVTNLIPLAAASMLAALLMILTGCVTIDEAYEAVDWKSIVLIAGMLPMSTALEKVGLVNLFAQELTNNLGAQSPLVVLGSLFVLSSIFTQVLSNTATTVLIAPIGLAAAQELNIQPYAFLMAIAIAASMAFASPVASPVNTLVMGAGNYRFSDYIKVGVPMILLMLFVSMILLPLLWPF